MSFANPPSDIVKNKLMTRFKNYHEKNKIIKHEGLFSPLLFGTAASSFDSFLFRKYYPKLNFGPALFLSKNGEGVCFFSFETYLESAEYAIKRYLEDEANFSDFDDFELLELYLKKLYLKYDPKTISKIKTSKLIDLINTAFSIVQDIQVITLFSGGLYDTVLKKYFSALSLSSEINQERFIEMSSLVFFSSFTQILDSELLNHEKDDLYPIQWIFSNYSLVPSLDELPNLVTKLVAERNGFSSIENDVNSLNKQIKKNISKLEKFKKTLSPELLLLFEFVQKTIRLRDLRKESIFRSFTLLSNLVREFLVRKQIPSYLASQLFYADFKQKKYLKDDFKKLLLIRQKGCLSYHHDGFLKSIIVNYSICEDELFSLVNESCSSTIQGFTAMKGFVKGVARIIVSISKKNEFNKGDILVTSMTRPEFVPLMKIAGAIVTDEGGLTCHAAIIAREFKLPCIVGTQNATRMIKDGDIVEVDADKCVVKILKKRN